MTSDLQHKENQKQVTISLFLWGSNYSLGGGKQLSVQQSKVKGRSVKTGKMGVLTNCQLENQGPRGGTSMGPGRPGVSQERRCLALWFRDAFPAVNCILANSLS